MLRNRKPLKVVKNFDAFPKVPESYVETSSVGGAVSVICWLLIAWLMVMECTFFLDTKYKFRFVPDTDFDAKLKFNVDITIAMPCAMIGADILDSTNQNIFKFGSLEEEDTWFELSDEQQQHFEAMRHMNSYLREEFHALQELLWKSGYSSLYGEMPKRSVVPNTPTDACRIYGSLVLNKVAGNFHITAGKSLALPRGHVHISAFMTERDYNFSHRIDRLSFGDPSAGIIHPLEGDEKITNESRMLFQYFVEVVPTEVDTFRSRMYTYQYSVKELERPIDHDKGSHGVPGIFVKYDMSALKVIVSEESETFWQFLVRLCAIVGGVFVTSGLINELVQFLVNLVTCHYLRRKKDVEPETIHIPVKTLLEENDNIHMNGPHLTNPLFEADVVKNNTNSAHS